MFIRRRLRNFRTIAVSAGPSSSAVAGSGTAAISMFVIETGIHVDDAWSAPIWITPEGGVVNDEPTVEGFVKSKFSVVYHYRQCAIAKQIEQNGNLVPHTPKPGDGTRLHKNCPTTEDEL